MPFAAPETHRACQAIVRGFFPAPARCCPIVFDAAIARTRIRRTTRGRSLVGVGAGASCVVRVEADADVDVYVEVVGCC